MSYEIQKILDDLARRFGVMIDWTEEHVLPYMLDLFERIVLYERIMAIAVVVIILAITTGGIVAFKKGMNCVYKDKDDALTVTLTIGGGFFTAVGAVGFITSGFSAIRTIIQSFILPELIILNTIQGVL